MKILLLGSLISAAQMEQLNGNSKEKASVAPVNYETMLVKFRSNLRSMTENLEKC